jgi:hypothetical protein
MIERSLIEAGAAARRSAPEMRRFALTKKIRHWMSGPELFDRPLP